MPTQQLEGGFAGCVYLRADPDQAQAKIFPPCEPFSLFFSPIPLNSAFAALEAEDASAALSLNIKEERTSMIIKMILEVITLEPWITRIIKGGRN